MPRASLACSGALGLSAFALVLSTLDPSPSFAGGRERGVKLRQEGGEEEDEGDDAPGGGSGAPPAAPAEPVDDDALSARVETILRQRPCRTTNGVVTLEYPLSDPTETDDFRIDGYDKVEVRDVKGQRAGGVGLELGAGSRGTGRLQHKLLLSDDFEIEAEWWLPMNTPSAVVCFVLNEKVGVLFGQQLVKPSSMRPWSRTNPAADPTEFREEREARMKVTATNGMEMTVEFGGRRVAQHRFTRGELKQVRFGLISRNCRMVLTSVRITGKLDPAHLE